MARRTTTFIKSPWNGGLNSSVDAGVLPDNDLVLAENVVFSSSGARVKREGFSYVGQALPAITHKSSSTTTRTLVFASSINIASPLDELLVVGEKITLSSTDATEQTNYGGTVTINTITTTNVANDTITYTMAGSLTQGSTATSTLSITRASKYLDVRDYWYLDGTYVKNQLLMAFSSQGKLFRYDTGSGRRKEIKAHPERATITTVADSAGSLNSTWFKIYDSAGSVGVYFTNGGGTPPGGVDRTLSVSFTNNDSADTIATALKTALDADGEFVATNVTNVVTVTQASSGDRTNVADGTAPTGFTFATTINGRSTTQPFGASTLTTANSVVLNERYIVAMSGTGNTPIYFNPNIDADYYFDLSGAPDCTFLIEHLGRLWTDDKTDKDLIHYSSIGNPEEWLGNGDSGALPISPGDGDPKGVVSIFPSLKGNIFVAKGGKLYRVAGFNPEDFQVIPVTGGVGCEAHKSAASVDSEDVLWISKRGVHSLATTDQYGDFSASFLSSKIQPTFNEWPQAALSKTSAIYIPEINSVAMAVINEDSVTTPNQLYLFNTTLKEWYNWPDVDVACLATRLDNNERRRLIWGTSDSRIVQTENGDYTDFTGTAIRYRVKSGRIYPDSNPHSYKGFKKLSFIFRPRGRYSFTVRYKIDNLPTQSVSFADSTQGDILGSTFILGQSVLGNSLVLAPVTQPISGYGRGITIEIENNNADEFVEIYGFVLEYEIADVMQDVNQGS